MTQDYLTNAKSRLNNFVFNSDHLTVKDMIECCKVEVLFVIADQLEKLVEAQK